MKINLIPMAGMGQRYVDEGYTVPKPLISVDGLPMVVRAYNSLPKSDKNILICQKKHLQDYPVQEILEEYIPNLVIVDIGGLSEGQAITCLAAKKHIPDNSILTIGASDNDMTYDSSQIELMYNDSKINGWVWTFRNNPAVLQNPKMYGWVKQNMENDNAKEIICKTPISNNPINDHAVIGAFTFKKAKYFFDSVDMMVKENNRINNEFYVDVAMDYCIKLNKNIKIFEVDKYICWGTPRDYETYNYWLSYFKNRFK